MHGDNDIDKDPAPPRQFAEILKSSYILKRDPGAATSGPGGSPAPGVVPGMKSNSPLTSTGYDLTTGNYDGMHAFGNLKDYLVQVSLAPCPRCCSCPYPCCVTR
jgi:hypothetical protein